MTLPRNTSTNADIREARNELGARLRDLRRAAGLTGQRLADLLSWVPSKVSKIEHGRQSPTVDDIRVWCRAVSDETAMEGLLADLNTIETRYQEWQRIMRGGLGQVQSAVTRREQETRIFRGYQSLIVPGLFQTPEYARGLLEQSGRVWTQGEGVEEAVTARMRRQEILYDPSKKFRIVLTEAVLLYAICAPEAMLAQLDRLMSLSMLSNVRLGIIPFERRTALAPEHSFWVYDDDLVLVETVSAQLNLQQQQEIELHTKVFESMALDADYDQKARAVLQRASKQIAARITAEKG
ncbi:helix-turn-helix transcriptional regulator [Promicromonospora sp. NPDC023805]|uniref:helix-turn-helix domain-containing protein n=1 Tax=Promicromonospora sp. NPDC023805 TaxID=3154696 RepID=UPI003401581E